MYWKVINDDLGVLNDDLIWFYDKCRVIENSNYMGIGNNDVIDFMIYRLCIYYLKFNFYIN